MVRAVAFDTRQLLLAEDEFLTRSIGPVELDISVESRFICMALVLFDIENLLTVGNAVDRVW